MLWFICKFILVPCTIPIYKSHTIAISNALYIMVTITNSSIISKILKVLKIIKISIFTSKLKWQKIPIKFIIRIWWQPFFSKRLDIIPPLILNVRAYCCPCGRDPLVVGLGGRCFPHSPKEERGSPTQRPRGRGPQLPS